MTTVLEDSIACEKLVAADENSPQTRRDLCASVSDAGTFNLMVGMGETYIAPFAVALGSNSIATGLLTTVPIFAGSILQLATPRMVRRFGSHRAWVVWCAVVQAIALLILPLAVIAGGWGVGLIFLAATLYWASGQAGNPAWNTWIEDVVPVNVRTRFFARRSRISQLCLLSAFVVGGLLLEWGKSVSHDTGVALWTMLAFTGLFVTAACCRFASAWYLSRHSEPNRGKMIDQHISLAEWGRRLREHSGTKLLLFLFAMQASVYISGPFFTSYMLDGKYLHMSYFPYMLLVSTCFIGKAIALPLWGRFAHRYGAQRLLWTGACAILPLSAMWIVSQHLAWIMLIQLLSGLTWAGFELAIVLMFFEAVPRHERMSLVTLYNLSNSSAMICGTLVGAVVLRYFESSLTGYFVIFGMSSFCRIFAVLLLTRLSKTAVDKVPLAVEGAFALHPTTDGMDIPILPGIPEAVVEPAAKTANTVATTEPSPRAA